MPLAERSRPDGSCTSIWAWKPYLVVTHCRTASPCAYLEHRKTQLWRRSQIGIAHRKGWDSRGVVYRVVESRRGCVWYARGFKTSHRIKLFLSGINCYRTTNNIFNFWCTCWLSLLIVLCTCMTRWMVDKPWQMNSLCMHRQLFNSSSDWSSKRSQQISWVRDHDVPVPNAWFSQIPWSFRARDLEQ